MLNDDFELSIPKETLASMPIVTYPGEITVIDSAIDTVKALRFLSSLPLVGFDTETKPNFRPGRTNNVALIQIYSPNRCFLFRINKTGLTDEMVRFLESEKTVKVGVSLHDDFRNLNKIRQVNPHAEIGGIDVTAQDQVFLAGFPTSGYHILKGQHRMELIACLAGRS